MTWNGVGTSASSSSESSDEDIDRSNWWNGWSPNSNNDRYREEPRIGALPTTKNQFKQLWYTKLNGPVSMTPTVYQDRVYVSTLTGTFYCLQAANGNIVWQKNFSNIINNGYGYYSRNSPLIYKNMIIVGLTDVNVNIVNPILGHGSYVIAFNALNGALQWKTLVSSHPASILTNNPQLAANLLFIGISSLEELFAANPAYPCCSFQGSVVALNASTGKFLWETKMIPDNNGTTNQYSGAAVWGSQFPVDYKRNQIYIGVGNYYDVPAAIEQCLKDTSNLTYFSDPCNEPGAYSNAILALDMHTGLVRWSRILSPVDAWTVACILQGPRINCPSTPGPDFDFGQAPILKTNFKYKFGGSKRDQLFVGQKSGIAFGLDAETGTLTWSTQVAPGAISGGILFGSAADDQYIYVGNNNGGGLSYTLPDGSTTTKASWSALDLVTGDVKWTTVDPTTNVAATSAYLPLTIWDKIVLVQGGSPPQRFNTPIKGCLYGLNKNNGQVLYETCIENTPIGSGASVAGNTIYVGIGYRIPRIGTDGVLALQLP